AGGDADLPGSRAEGLVPDQRREDPAIARVGGGGDQEALPGAARQGLGRRARPRREAAAALPEGDPADRAGAAMRRLLGLVLLAAAGALAFPALALAHDAPENAQSRWVMADWMMDTFFVFGGLAL